jgi:tetratricopeptide (TPR) repeat protein
LFNENNIDFTHNLDSDLRYPRILSKFTYVEMLLKEGRYGEVFPQIDWILEKRPSSPLAYQYLADALRGERRYEDAAKAYEIVSSLDPGNVAALGNYAGVLAELKRYEEAIRIYDRILRLTEDETHKRTTHYNLGEIYYRLGDTALACQHFREADSISTAGGPIEQRLERVCRVTSSAERSTATAVPPDIEMLLSRWQSSTLSGDLESQVDCYAPLVEVFFRKVNVPREAVRLEKKKVLEQYPRTLTYEISDLQLESLAERRATITFRKEWDARGLRRFAGAERQRLTLAKVDGSWKIVGEQELEIYWVERR